MTADIKSFLQNRFPKNSSVGGSGEKTNSAIMLYGRRFYRDQTPVEYLAELLLVFLSAKSQQDEYTYSFSIDPSDARYFPEDHVALKLFSFYPTSKLETRHEAHQATYLEALSQVKKRIQGGDERQQEDTVRLLQSLFSGFTGVAKNRTWATYSFLPAAPSLISRELNWRHKKAKADSQAKDWESSRTYFDTVSHLFMARGGELLFLQLAHLFSLLPEQVDEELGTLPEEYSHLPPLDLAILKSSLEEALTSLLSGSLKKIDQLASFVEATLSDVTLSTDKIPNKATLGWVPRASVPEAYLFAQELMNICQSSHSELDKLEMMQTLCCLQVIRSLSFQAQRIDQPNKTTRGFLGNYVWIVCDPNAPVNSASRRLSQTSFDVIESMLFRVLRVVQRVACDTSKEDKEADDHGFKIFRKIAKDIGLVIPRTGRGQRFVLTPSLVRVLVAATVKPGERVRLTEFYQRVFAHFGIALANQQLSVAIAWSSISTTSEDYVMTTDSLWIEEALNQGGFLVELSDAVSIVHNPSNKEF